MHACMYVCIHIYIYIYIYIVAVLFPADGLLLVNAQSSQPRPTSVCFYPTILRGPDGPAASAPEHARKLILGIWVALLV